jgi:hypothetical protein
MCLVGMVREGVPDGTPDVDDPHATFEQTIGVFGSVLTYAGQGSGIRLIDVHACLDGEKKRRQ